MLPIYRIATGSGESIAYVRGYKKALHLREAYYPGARIYEWGDYIEPNKLNEWQDDFYFAPDPHPYSQSAINDAINEYYGTTGDNLEAIFDEADGYGYKWGYYDGYDIEDDLLR